MHFPSPHLYLVGGHETESQCNSSSPFGQSFTPLQYLLSSMQRDAVPALHLNCLSVHVYLSQSISSELSPQLLTPSQNSLGLIHRELLH